MKVVIPLAGKGSRLRPHTHVSPKPLLKIADKPLMSYILDDLRELDVHEAVIIYGHLKEKVVEYMDRDYPDFHAVYVEQPVQNGTAGAVVMAEPHVQEEMLIIFVDTLFETDLTIVRRLPPDVAGVIWAKEVEDYQRFGVIVTDEQGFMRQIIEKPEEPVSRLANIGLYYVRDWKLFFEGVNHVMNSPPHRTGEYFLTDAFQYMIDQGAKILTAEVETWLDAGKPEALIETNRHLLQRGRTRPPENGRNVRVHDPVYVAEGVTLEDVEIGPNVSISSGGVLRRSRVRDSIVWNDAVVEDCDLHDSLVGSEARVSGVRGCVDVGDQSLVDVTPDGTSS
ncbi:MAG TPA: sugar phosphate nucleotidyltransferase [Longimicrobiaceae bacterium]|nr:sugar phosphate nucleotidyltransferase [Longimicrobiaceae bacterium]